MPIKKSKEKFVEEAKKVHGYYYGYDNVIYKNNKTPVIITCPVHGDFLQRPEHHLSGHGCKKCQYDKLSENFKYKTDEFVKKAKEVHNDFYKYDKTKYVTSKIKICVTCPIHGDFYITPAAHLAGEGCPKCGREIANRKTRLTKEEFIKKAKEVHNGLYLYDNLEYINSKTKVCITCPTHGDFWQNPRDHLTGHGCPECKKESLKRKHSFTLDDFLKIAKQTHGEKYNYSKVEYINSRSKVCIVCPEHGEFWQTPSHHLNGVGCPLCRTSKMESEIDLLLKEQGIKFVRQYHCDWLGKLSLDFYLPDFNTAIECQGEQHFELIEHFGGEEKLKKTIERDNCKMLLCNKHNIRLLYFARKKYKPDIYTDKNKLLNVVKNISLNDRPTRSSS